MMKQKHIDYFMDIAERTAQLSSARRTKVGSIIVKDDRIISIGYNGTPSGWSNDCEDIDYFTYDRPMGRNELNLAYPFVDENGNHYRFKTKPEVIHAELNSISKLAKSNESGLNATMFITCSPCQECSKAIYTAGIKTVYYTMQYRDLSGIDFLNRCGIDVIRIPR